jgi:hypothetical protein
VKWEGFTSIDFVFLSSVTNLLCRLSCDKRIERHEKSAVSLSKEIERLVLSEESGENIHFCIPFFFLVIFSEI